MTKTVELALALAHLYPHKEELSKARLTKLVYLCDWEAAKSLGRQITPIKWKFHQFGPYVDDIYEGAVKDPRFLIVDTKNFYGEGKTLIQSAVKPPVKVGLSKEEIDIARKVIDATKNLYWGSFIKFVYDTDPVAKSRRFSELDLVAFANQIERRPQQSVK